MTLFIGIDDTDILDVSGTGKLARAMANRLLTGRGPESDLGISRHQLLQDPRVPCTRKNRCACLVLDVPPGDRRDVIAMAREVLLALSIVGSDPGLCVAWEEEITPAIVAHGRAAKKRLLTKDDAYALARGAGILLEEHGGTGDGVIGALAAVGLRRDGEDGWVPKLRGLEHLRGTVTAAAFREHGVEVIEAVKGQPVPDDAMVHAGEKPRPVVRTGRILLAVERTADAYRALPPLKL